MSRVILNLHASKHKLKAWIACREYKPGPGKIIPYNEVVVYGSAESIRQLHQYLKEVQRDH